MSSQQMPKDDTEQAQSKQTPDEGLISELEDSQLNEVAGGAAQNHELELQQRRAEDGGN